ncbi:MAG TPA: GNAT family protein [Polyangia bacterium]|nr:GNAT family protein [Polyangia bacterium]
MRFVLDRLDETRAIIRRIDYPRPVPRRFVIELEDGDRLSAREPTRAEVAKAAPQLASFYNEPHNRAMLAHEESQSSRDVVEHYRELAREGARAFFLEVDGRMVGDADLRNVTRSHAEVAILVGDRSLQGRGLGTRFGVMLHSFAFSTLGLRRTYATIIPANAGSLRLFEKLGYERDGSRAARRFMDDESDVTLSLTPGRFHELHGELAARVKVSERRTRIPASPRPVKRR